jgi:hypothetical protein
VLADLLVSVAVLGLVMSANLLVLDQGRRALAIGAARVESQQTARIALHRLARELRTAGSSPRTPAFSAITVAEPERLTLHRDLDGDGEIAVLRETVTWKLDGTILRREAGGGAQPIVNGVRALEFRYVDDSGTPTIVPADVRGVTITLATVSASTPGAAAPTTVSTHVRLRNR